MFILNLLAIAMIVAILGMVFYGTVRVILWDLSQKVTFSAVMTCVLVMVTTLGTCFGANAAPISFPQVAVVCLAILPWVLVYIRADQMNNGMLRVRVSS